MSTKVLWICFLGYILTAGADPNLHSGQTYEFNYETKVAIFQNELKPSSHKIKAVVELQSLWSISDEHSTESLIQIKLGSLALEVPSTKDKSQLFPHSSALETDTQFPILVHWKNGVVTQVYVSLFDTESQINLKKGVASLLYYHPVEGKTKEIDVSGECEVEYEVFPQNNAATKFKNCSQILPNSIRYPKVERGTHLEYSFNAKGFIQNVHFSDQVIMRPFLWKDAQLSASSISKFNFHDIKDSKEGLLAAKDVDEALATLIQKLQLGPEPQSLEAKPEVNKETAPKKVAAVVKTYQKLLKDNYLATVKSASVFLKLLPYFQVASKEDLISILNNKQNAGILPQIVDILGVTSNLEALEAMFEVFDFTSPKSNLDLLERYLLTLSISSHPPLEAVDKLLKLSKQTIHDEKLRATLLLALGSVANTVCLTVDCDHKAVKQVQTFFLESLKHCTSEECKVLLVRALVNAALPQTASLLLDIVVKDSKSVTIPALQAIKKIASNHPLSSEVGHQLLNIYLQDSRSYDSSVRILAAEILLTFHLDQVVLDKILATLPSVDDSELKTLLLGHLQQVKQHPTYQNTFQKPDVSNYHSLSTRGKSMTFTNPLAESGHLNSTYSVQIENGPGGLMKRSSFTLDLIKEDDFFQLLSVGLFAGGMGSFAGGDDSAPEEEEPATAGMELGLFGHYLRPYVFFSGSGELMSLVWSGAGAESTSALKGNFLLVDHSNYFALSDGQVLTLTAQTVLSLDITGQIEISIWNRNSHSVVKSKVSVISRGSLDIDSSFVSNSANFTLSGDALVDIVTDLDFYDTPLKMCVQMNQPDIKLNLIAKKACKIPGSKYFVKSTNKKNVQLLGKSFQLNSQNTKACRLLLAEQ